MPKSFFPDSDPAPLTSGERALARTTIVLFVIAVAFGAIDVISWLV